MLAWIIIIAAISGIIAIYWHRFKDTQRTERVKVKLDQIEGEDSPKTKVKKMPLQGWKRQSYDYRAVNDAYNKADIFYARGDFENAHKAFIYVLSLDPDHEESNNKIGLIYLQKEMFTKAESIFKKLIEDHPRNPTYYGNLAMTYYGMNQKEDARKMYEAAIKLDPKKISRIINLANICEEIGDLKGAVSAYSKALELNNRNTEIYFVIAELLVKLKAYDEAIAVMVSLQDLQPYNSDAKEKEREIKILKGTNPLNNVRGKLS